MSDMVKSDGEVRKILESTNLSETSIYSLDRKLEVGDIVYGYLTNHFGAKFRIIERCYPFRVVRLSDNGYHKSICLLGLKAVGRKFTFPELSEYKMIDFYAHFIHKGEAMRFNGHIPTVFDLSDIETDKSIRDESVYRTLTSIGENEDSNTFCVKNGILSTLPGNCEYDIVPFIEIEFDTAINYKKIYRETYLTSGPCGKGNKACCLCDCGYGCLASTNDDEFDLAEKDLLIDRLNNPKSVNAPRTNEERALAIKILKDVYDYDYKEENNNGND